MALALVVVIRSKKRVTTSSSDPFNKIFRRSVVCVSFSLYTPCQNYYTQKIFVTALFIVSGNFFFNVTRFNKLTCFFFGNVNKNIMNSQILFLGKYILLNQFLKNKFLKINRPSARKLLPLCSYNNNNNT